ncbi:MAG TPA: pirin family protein [Micromonosporaceae bacterium]|nr:pirin family protein [Micromonosporaceae bacterium]
MSQPVLEVMPGRDVVLGPRVGVTVSRTLPHRERRMVGAWCFLDQMGPSDIGDGRGMRIAPHPHTGLQTVTWLLRGEMLHRDSLGSEQVIRPGELNLMTAGRGIAHSEESVRPGSPVVHGVQLWTALPDADRATGPHFEHHADLPVISRDGVALTVFLGEFAAAGPGGGSDGVVSPARTYSPLVGAEAALTAGADTVLPLRPDFEYAVLVLTGSVRVAGAAIDAGPLLYLGTGRSTLALSSVGGARVLVIGGLPFEERIVMWWNFVGRTSGEVAQAREEWMAGAGRFGEVRGYDGAPLPAPPLPGTPLLARGRVR